MTERQEVAVDQPSHSEAEVLASDYKSPRTTRQFGTNKPVTAG